MSNHCPACGAEAMKIFYSKKNIPVHSVRLIWSRDEALHFQNGDMDLAHCPVCGFICNLSYDPKLQDYSAEYESTQAYSPTFNSFSHRLARQLIDRYDLHGKKIIEIGCGQGEFLSLLCDLGENQGTGFDPAYDPSRPSVALSKRATIISDYYSEKYTSYTADFICCKMTLEHIRDVGDFIATVRRSIGNQHETTVFFQIPDVDRVLKEVAFWDIYYEHCSYFSKASLARLFQSQDFDVSRVWRDYDDQYLMIEAHPHSKDKSTDIPPFRETDIADISAEVSTFTNKVTEVLEHWKVAIRDAYEKKQKIVLWGSGSKGVAFLTTLNICDEIEYTVDINPNKHGTYMAGTGQKVVSPDFLIDYRPDLVILMNPVYRKEVQQELQQRGITAHVICVGE